MLNLKFSGSRTVESQSLWVRPANYWFWRTHAQQEIDYIEERDGVLSAWEFKWKATKPPRLPKSFLDANPGCVTGHVSPDTMEDFLLEGSSSG